MDILTLGTREHIACMGKGLGRCDLAKNSVMKIILEHGMYVI